MTLPLSSRVGPIPAHAARIFVVLLALTAGFGRLRSAGHAGEAAPRDESHASQPETPIEEVARPGEIEEFDGHPLDHFLSTLAAIRSAGVTARVCHYGDSPITNDDITKTVRRELQERFGDGGHGFVLLGRPWGWYGHDGIEIGTSTGWSVEPIGPSRHAGTYGLGGVAFSSPGGASSLTVTAESAGVFDLAYLAQPGGGSFDVWLDGAPVGRASTAAVAARSEFLRVSDRVGRHSIALRPVGDGDVRVFGVTAETGTAGVVYDSLGVNGAYVGLLARAVDEDHWIQQLRHRAPDLVVLSYGTNESQFDRLPMDEYERDFREAIRRIRAALPSASILVVAPMDRAMRGPGGTLITRPMIPKLVEYQRRIASENGCAFFDTYAAMGGEGTAARWATESPHLMGGDYTHPTARGAERVGGLLAHAILDAYERWTARRPGLNSTEEEVKK